MTTNEPFERMVTAVMADDARGRAPDRVLDQILVTTGRMRPMPRWLALIKEPPMRLSSRVAVGSPVVRVAYLAGLTLLLVLAATGVVVAGASLLPSPVPQGPPWTIVVDPAGEITTISQGVERAQPGDTVLIRPGTYAEQVVIDKDITVEGDGARGDVVIPYTEDSPTAASYWGANLPNAISILDASVTLRHVSIEGLNYGIGILVAGGDALVEDVSINLPGEYAEREGGGGRWAIHLADGATATLRDVSARGFIAILDGASATVERAELIHDGFWLDGSGAATLVTDSVMPGVLGNANARGSFTGNRIAGNVTYEGGLLEFTDNIIEGDGTTTGVHLIGGDPRLVGNTISHHATGILIENGGGPVIEGNNISDNTTGVSVQGPIGSPYSFAGNTFCGNGTDLLDPDGSDLTMDTNIACDTVESIAP